MWRRWCWWILQQFWKAEIQRGGINPEDLPQKFTLDRRQ
jgi:hypothetical protein